MRRLPLVLALLVLMTAARSLTLVTLQNGDSAHCTADVLVQTSALDADCLAFTPTPTLVPTATSTETFTATPTNTVVPTSTATSTSTSTPTATATNTLIPTLTATWTPLPSATFTATATNTPVVATNTPLPRAQWPLCPSHDPNAWHALDDVSRQCFYDHEHGRDSHLGDAVFGSWGTAWGGQQISYPWATSIMENTHKHGGYKIDVRLNRPCDPTNSYDGRIPINCVTDARVEFHFVGHSMDALARYHSYYLEYRVCKYPAYTQCGIIRMGGWMDMGVMNAPYAGRRLFRPGGTVDFGMGSTYGGANSQLIMTFSADTPDLDQIATVGSPCCDDPYISIGNKLNPLDGSRLIVWSMNNVGGANHFGSNPYARFLVRTFDSWGWIDPANVNSPQWFCRDGSCADNGSSRALGENSVWIPTSWDVDGDGFADASGYTNRLGQVVVGCAAVSLDCVPFSLVHVPVGYADTRDPGNGSGAATEFDTSPAGQRRIRFPN